MSGFRRINTNTQGILLWTLTLDGQVVDRDYILSKLKSRGITHVSSSVKQNAPKDIDAFEWLNRSCGLLDKNYIYLLYYLTIFCAHRWPDRKKKDYEQFVNIHSATWTDLLPNRLLPIIRNILTAAEVLEYNDNFLSASAAKKAKKKPFSKSVRVFPAFENKVNTKSLPDIDTARVIENSDWLKQQESNAITGHLNTTEVIKINLGKIRLVDEALDFAQKAEYSSNNSRNKNISLIESVASYALMSLTPKERDHTKVFANYHEHTGRMTHCLSSFPRVFRKFLRVKNYPIWNVDASAMHPCLAIKLYDYAKAAPSRIAYEKAQYKKRFSHNSDFYLTIGQLGEIERKPDQTDDEFRDMLKKEVMLFLNGNVKAQNSTHLAKAYKKRFPILFSTMIHLKQNLIWKRGSLEFKELQKKLAKENTKKRETPLVIKDVYYKQVSQLLQRWEGDVILKQICARLVTEGVVIKDKTYQPWFIPFHDAIWTKQSFVKPIKKIMKEECLKLIGTSVPFKSSKWS
jgi:hypothetical protein